ncbi:MAG TPA: nitroreductase family protein [Thermomicrobiales bacterium]|nr:nitroreductase family protein [Thermomicrobiales bacterium]
MPLNLTPDELLSTTRSVSKRLDFSRPVEHETLEECFRLAQQAPSAGDQQMWSFIVVEDAPTKAALGDIYRRGAAASMAELTSGSDAEARWASLGPDEQAAFGRKLDSANFLIEHIQDAPVLVVPAVAGRLEQMPPWSQAALWGSIAPATWSFMLALRSRGLGSAWTTFHLRFERDAADLLGIPYAEITQIALLPVAYTLGTDFKPAPRRPLETMVHWGRW